MSDKVLDLILAPIASIRWSNVVRDVFWYTNPIGTPVELAIWKADSILEGSWSSEISHAVGSIPFFKLPFNSSYVLLYMVQGD